MTAIEDAKAALSGVNEWSRRYSEEHSGAPTAENLAFLLRHLTMSIERLSVPPSDDDREVAERIILEHFHAPDALHPSWRIRPAEMFDALAAAGFRRQGPITDEAVEAARDAGVVAQIKAEALREAADIASEYDREALHMRDHESDYPESRVGMQYHGMHHGAADVAIRLRRRADQIEQGGELVTSVVGGKAYPEPAVPSTTEPSDQEQKR